MSKKSRRSGKPAASTRRRPTRRPRRDEPDLMHDVADALHNGDPLVLIGLVSSLWTAVDPRCRNPFQPAEPGPSREELVESFLGIAMPETSALLAVIGELSQDEVLRRRIRRELDERDHPLPDWLTGLQHTVALPRVVETSHVLGDGDNVLVGVRLPGGHELTAVVYIDHNMGTLVKDAFVLSAQLAGVIDRFTAIADDPDTRVLDLPPADARARITQAVDLAAISVPPLDTDTWPACRPVVEWIAGLLPPDGHGYPRPVWDDDALAELSDRFLASPFGAGLDDGEHRGLLGALLWFGTDYGPGDPLRWSPTAVEILLTDWIPRKIVDEVTHLRKAPDLLRAFVGFCHHERGLRATLTEQTLAAVDAYEPEYQALIRSDRPQGPAALLDMLGLLDEPEPGFGELMLDTLRRAVGGEDALDTLDADPLPDEDFAWDAVPVDVHERVREVLALVDRCCAALLDVEYRTVCRRLLAGAAAGDPEIFRRRSRAANTAAAVCWVAGKANSLFDRTEASPTMPVKDLFAHFGVAATASQRRDPLLRAIGVDPRQHGRMDLGSARYLTSHRRADILARRDRYRGLDD